MECGIKNQTKIVLMCAPARAGKDTLLPLIKRDLENQFGGVWHRYAFADQLRVDLEEKIKERYGVSVWDDSKKHLFRDTMIKYGEQKRKETDNRYLVDHFIEQHKPNVNYIISDFRFINELFDLQKRFDDITPIYIERVIKYKNGLNFVTQPTIPQEVKNYPEIKRFCKTYQVPWETGLFWKWKLHNYHFNFGNSQSVTFKV
jgi:hypothetical protein